MRKDCLNRLVVLGKMISVLPLLHLVPNAHDGLVQKSGKYNDWHMDSTPDNFAAAYPPFSNFTGTSTVNPTMIREFAVVGNNALAGVNWSAMNEHPT